MANINPPDSKPSLVKVPKNYPMVPQPGKISQLFEANEHNLYHKLSPWDHDGSNYFGANQPYIYYYPDERPSSFMTTGGRGLPLGYGTNDLIRVTKFLASGRGLIFVGKQFLLQGYQSFDETNIYNPTEVIISAASNLTGGLLDKPKRHIDKSGGLLGGLAALVGVSVSRGSPPPSTVAAGNGKGGSSEGSLIGGFSLTGAGGNNRETEVLPVQNYGNATGLLRAGTANKARSILQQKWSTPTGGSGGGFLGFLKGIAKSIFPQAFGADKQNYKQRADDVAYEWMVKYYNDYTAEGLAKGIQNTGLSVGFMGINLFKSPSKTAITKVSDSKNLFKLKYYKDVNGESKIYIKDGSYFVSNDDYKSELEVRFDDGKGNFNKLNDVSKADTPASQINESLKRVITNIGNSQIYTTNFDNKDTWLLSSGQPSKQGYDRLYDIAKTPYNMKNNPNSVESAYYNGNIRTLDSIINPNKNYGMAGNSRPDKINTLTVLGKDKKVKDNLIAGYTEWKPYDDDLIAFFFYDVVNEKYIPFRATVKNLSEANNALWDELRFIGRSDALYSYTGFTRNLSFNFTVVINSLVELWPTWQRINYLASSVKPSNYTKKTQNDGVTNRFIIPPMFMLTIGDLYKYQPIVITTVAVNIPEGASWETVPENSTEDWSYLGKIIKSSKVKKEHIGQVPREIEISIACNVLEKERAQVGGCHYGHAVRSQLFADSDVEHLQYLEGWSKNIRSVKLADVDD